MISFRDLPKIILSALRCENSGLSYLVSIQNFPPESAALVIRVKQKFCHEERIAGNSAQPSSMNERINVLFQNNAKYTNPVFNLNSTILRLA